MYSLDTTDNTIAFLFAEAMESLKKATGTIWQQVAPSGRVGFNINDVTKKFDIWDVMDANWSFEVK